MNSPPTTRASLIGRLSDPEDVVAWSEFVEIYAPLVYRLARRMGLQAADADDLVQEVLASVSRSIAKWLMRSDRGRFRAWLFRTARNAAINHLTRRRYRPLAVGGGQAVDQLSLIAVCDTDSVEIEYQRELFRWASQRVHKQVAEPTWKAFWKTSIEGQPAAVVAHELEMTVGAVYIARSRVMARIRTYINTFVEESTDA